MDVIQPYEANLILDNIQYAGRNEWEQARLITYVTAQVNSKKHLDLKDICKFAWETESTIQDIKKEDVERLKEKSKEIGKMILQELQ